MVLRPHFLLTFGTTEGASRTLRINNPNEDVTGATMRGAMTGFINSQIVAGNNGRINTARRAQYVHSTATPIPLP